MSTARACSNRARFWRETLEKVKEAVRWLHKHLPEYTQFCNANPIFLGRLQGVGYLDTAACMALGFARHKMVLRTILCPGPSASAAP